MALQLTTKLEELDRALALCLKCKMCTYGDWPDNYALCPPYYKYEYFTYSGGGIVYLARAIRMGLIDYSPSVAEIVYKCTTCGNCDRICEVVTLPSPHIHPTDVVRLLRAELVERNAHDLDSLPMIAQSLKEEHNPFMQSHQDRFKDFDTLAYTENGTVIFVGCTVAYKHPEILRATAKILDRAGVDFGLLKDEWCSGAIAYDLGLRDVVPKLMEHNMDALRAAKEVIFLSPHDYQFFAKVYPKILGISELGFKTTFITQYVDRLMERGKVKVQKEQSQVVTYHDPCYLGRGMNDFDSARNILGRIPGLSLKEMERNRQNSYCCGAGGGVKLLYPTYAAEIAEERMKDALEVEVDSLVTACPLCKWSLGDFSQGIMVKDITEVVADALG